MLRLRLITPQTLDADYEKISGWWRARKFPVLPKQMLNSLGLVAETDGTMAAACWLYTASTGVLAMLEWIVSNPRLAPATAAKAVTALVQFATLEAERRGYPIVLTTCAQPSLGRVLEHAGYVKTASQLSHYVRVKPAENN